jgi:glycosyltransferase involved in cell wall biosynthesis
VLREAAVLSQAGHRVTVLGMMTSSTTAPAIEVRDGFVIRRLPYRARPPVWWIPPDFYARLRTRAQRQYRSHQGKIRDRILAMRHARLRLPAGLGTVPDRATGTGRNVLLWVGLFAGGQIRGWQARINRRHEPPPSPWRVQVRRDSARARFVRRLRGLARRAARTPLPDWPRKTRVVMVRVLSRAHTATMRNRRRAMRRLRLGRPTRRAMRSARRTGRAAWRAVTDWVAILRLLVWGSAYLAANGASRGAVEWLTGWRWRWLGWARYVAQHAPDADVWHGHDLTSLPAVVALKRQRGGITVYDSHEIYVESGRHAEQPRWAKRQLERLERDLVDQVDAIVTVNRSLAGILAERLRRPHIEVLYNCPARFDQANRPSRLRETLGLPADVPLMVYHGSLSPHRGVEQLLTAVQLPSLAGVHLAFLGFGPMRERLRADAAAPRYDGRVHVIDAVRPEELLDWLVGIDVAVAPIQPSTLNHRYSSPNKLFEAIAVGAPVAGSDFPEFRRVIADPAFGPLGALFDPSSPQAIASAVRSILDLAPPERAALTRRCRAAAARRWNWETESTSLVALYRGFANAAAPQPVHHAVASA